MVRFLTFFSTIMLAICAFGAAASPMSAGLKSQPTLPLLSDPALIETSDSDDPFYSGGHLDSTDSAHRSALPEATEVTAPASDIRADTRRGYLGYLFTLGEHFSFSSEFGVGYYGRQQLSSAQNASTSFVRNLALDLSAVGTYKLSQQFDLFTQAGFAYRSLGSTNRDDDLLSSDYSVAPLISAGFGYSITNNLRAHLNYLYLFSDKKAQLPSINTTNSDAMRAFNLGLKYNF